LAFSLPIQVRYEIGLTVLSIVIAALASGLALWIVSREHVAAWQIALGGVVMGGAIAGMHYTGMAALRLKATLTYEPVLFSLSILIAVVASVAALLLLTRFRVVVTRVDRMGRLVSAVVMGLAIAGMHYTGMAAAIFTPSETVAPGFAVEIGLLGVVAIAVSVVAVIVTVFVSVQFGQRLTNIALTQKFALIVALFILPLGVAVALFSFEQYTRIDQYGYHELYGTYYLRPLQKMLNSLGRHARLLESYANSSGKTTTFDDVRAVQKEVDGYLAELKTLDAQYGSSLKSTAELQRLETAWKIFTADVITMGPTEREGAHLTMANNINQLIAFIGNTSFLILDPDLVTYYPMDAVLLRLPESAMLINETTLLGVQAISRDNLTVGDSVRLQSATTRLNELLAGIERGLDVAYANDTSNTMRATLEPALTQYRISLQQYNNLINNGIAVAPNTLAERDELYQQTETLAQAQLGFYTTVSQALETGISARISNFISRLGGLIGFSILASLVALVFGALIFRAIAQPVSRLTQATRQLAAGDFGVRVNLPGTDETSQLALDFNNMARRLQEAQTEVARRAQALEVSGEVTRHLSTILDEEALVRAVVADLQEAFNYYHAHIYLYDDHQEYLVMRGGTGEAGQTLLANGHKIRRGRGLVGRAADTKAPVLVTDTKQDPNWLPNPLLPETRSELATPILLGDIVLGVIDVQQNTIHGLQALDAELLQLVAGQVAIALQNARTFTASQRRANRETFLNNLNRKLQSATSLERALEIATQELGQTLGARRAEGQLQIKAAEQKQARWQ
jgi:NO-binding membrane sensor protein with MHYT domain/putative methionine-R-sulfoxide reductase with GAF domain